MTLRLQLTSIKEDKLPFSQINLLYIILFAAVARDTLESLDQVEAGDPNQGTQGCLQEGRT